MLSHVLLKQKFILLTFFFLIICLSVNACNTPQNIQEQSPEPSQTQARDPNAVGKENSILLEISEFQNSEHEYVFPGTTWGVSKGDIETIHCFKYIDPLTTRPDRAVWVSFMIDGKEYAGIPIFIYSDGALIKSINISIQSVPEDDLVTAA